MHVVMDVRNEERSGSGSCRGYEKGNVSRIRKSGEDDFGLHGLLGVDTGYRVGIIETVRTLVGPNSEAGFRFHIERERSGRHVVGRRCRKSDPLPYVIVPRNVGNGNHGFGGE